MVLRLAPYPSGALHIGNAKTYLLNALYSEKYKGRLILVIDDTIGTREKRVLKEAYDLIEDAFRWLKVKYRKPVIYKSDRLKIYYEYAEKLIEKGHAVAIVGLQSDRHIAREIQLHCHSEYCIDLTGYTDTVRELMIIFHFASLLITNDGGPGYFASMTPIPSIIFYGPETPVLYGPLSENAFAFYRNLSCSPCLTAYNHRNSPCDGNNRCVKEIQLEDVIKKVDEKLSA